VRDPQRINLMVWKLGVVWFEHPDWRLGQVISNVLSLGPDEDVFHVEDERLNRALDDYIKRDNIERRVPA
jgi:hypothetical protein